MFTYGNDLVIVFIFINLTLRKYKSKCEVFYYENKEMYNIYADIY